MKKILNFCFVIMAALLLHKIGDTLFPETQAEYVKLNGIPISSLLGGGDKYDKTIIVDADGEVGTNCDFTELHSALDAISDNSANNTYLIKVMNGVYDISQTSRPYLGFKDYVTIEGETKTGVVIVNRKSSFSSQHATFDAAYYRQVINYACLKNMTLIVYNGKCPIHVDGGLVRGTMEFENLYLINENTEGQSHYRGGINLGCYKDQRFVVKNCSGQVYCYAHNGSLSEGNGGSLEIDDCNLLWVGFFDLCGQDGDDVFSVRNTKCDPIHFGTTDHSSTKTSIKTNFVSNETMSYMIDGSWFAKYPICENIHLNVKNIGSTAISKGSFVSLVDDSPAARYESFYQHIKGIEQYSSANKFIAYALDDFTTNEYGVVQTSGKVPISKNGLSEGDYIKLNESGVPVVGTKDDAIGIIMEIDEFAWMLFVE